MTKSNELNRMAKTAKMEYNQVILIGGNHHNGLGLVRSFGVHGIHPYGIVVGKGAKNSFIRKSKYWAKTWDVKDDEEAIALLKTHFCNCSLKPVVIPWSDGAAEAIDSHYDELSSFFILPSINNKQGEIVSLMDKNEQALFAEKYGIPMLATKVTSLIKDETESPLQFPVILKPVSSVEGTKDDMCICANQAEYNKAVSELKEKGFNRILIQQYLPERKEYVVAGAISDKRFSFAITEHIRQWPPKVGTGSYSKVIVSKPLDEFCKKTLDIIQAAGYRGPIDFEFFSDMNGRFYLNEINWRSSGRNFISIVNNIHSAYIYYCDVTGLQYSSRLYNDEEFYSMNDANDFKHIFKKEITVKQWIRDFKNAKSHSVWDRQDMKPFYARFEILFVNGMKKALKISDD